MKFETVHLCQLDAAGSAQLDALDFGVIGFDAQGVVQRYNRFESEAAGLSLNRVLAHPLFTVVAPCMNNYLVAQRFEDATAQHEPLDVTINYVLTLRMRPTRVGLRLLCPAAAGMRYVLVRRSGSAAIAVAPKREQDEGIVPIAALTSRSSDESTAGRRLL